MRECQDPEWSIGEYALAREFMRPLRSIPGLSPDPLATVAGALAHLREGELRLLQIMFAPAKQAWPTACDTQSRSMRESRAAPGCVERVSSGGVPRFARRI